MDCKCPFNIGVSDYSGLDAMNEAFDPLQLVAEQFKGSLKMLEALAEKKPQRRRGLVPLKSTLRLAQEKAEYTKERGRSFVDCKCPFNIGVSDYSGLDAMHEAFEHCYCLGIVAIESRHSEDECQDGPLNTLVAPEIEQLFDEQSKVSLKMSVGLAEERPRHRRGSAP